MDITLSKQQAGLLTSILDNHTKTVESALATRTNLTDNERKIIKSSLKMLKELNYQIKNKMR